MDYRFEQQSRPFIVALAALLAAFMVAVTIMYKAPWFFSATAAVSGLMAVAMLTKNERAGLTIQGQTLALFHGTWSQRIDLGSIREVRITPSMGGQPSVWLELQNGPPYRLPGVCYGGAEPLRDVFCARGISISG